MLQAALRRPLDSRMMEKHALDPSSRPDQELSASPQEPWRRASRTHVLLVFLALLASLLAASFAEAQSDNHPAMAPGLFIEVRLDAPLKLTRLRPGSVLEGKVVRDVYSGGRQVFPEGSQVQLTVDHLERRPKGHTDHWPWVVRLFSPRYEDYPSVQSASITLPDGTAMPMHVSFVSELREIKVSAQVDSAVQSQEASPAASRVTSPKKRPRQLGSGAGPTWLLAAERPTCRDLPSTADGENPSNPVSPPLSETLAAGTQAHIILLDFLSASKSHAGDSFQSRLLEPVRLGSRVVLPEGAVFEGRVVRSVHPRWFSRPGSLQLTFTELALPTGEDAAAVASPAAVMVDQRSRLRMNSEGGLSGGSPGKVRLLLDLGVSGGIAKVSDDSFQLIAEALISTATDASTAGSARLVAAAFSVVYFITRHGRDVVLPQYTKMDITFDQPFRPPHEKELRAVRDPGDR